MAANKLARDADLKGRCERLGLELLTNDAGDQFVLEGTQIIFIHREGDDRIADLLDGYEYGRRMPANRSAREAQLRARLDALDCQLFEDETNDDDDDHYYVLDKKVGKLVSVCASLDDTYAWLEEKERAGKRVALCPGDHEVPAALRPALSLYEDSVNEAEAMTAEAIADYLSRGDGAVAGKVNDKECDDFTFVQPQLTRHGLSSVYALHKLRWILRGVEEVEQKSGATK